LTTTTLDGEATFDSLIIGIPDGRPAELNFEAPGLTGVRWEFAWVADARLRLRSGIINGRVLSGAVPVVHVQPGEPLEGRVSLLYTSRWTTATVFLGAVATWEPRETDTVSVRSLVTPLESGRAEVNVRRIAPRAPGRYFLLWALGAEPRAAFIFAGTNWSCGSPRWHDGDDLHDLPPDSLRAAATRGSAEVPITKCLKERVPSPPYRTVSPVGLAAVEVVVERRP
jgi:hypothetical protein